jgi:hypothetical protein
MAKDSSPPDERYSFAWLADPLYEDLLDKFSPHDPLQAVRNFFGRPYWSRVWTLQEMLLSKSAIIICGRDTCRLIEAMTCFGFWPLFSPVGDHPTGVSDRVRDFAVGLMRARSVSQFLSSATMTWLSFMEQTPTPEDNTLSVLAITRNLQATDPRDKLYSISNLTSLGVEVDYSLSYQALCRKFAEAQLARNHSIGKILAHAGIQSPRATPWPSWVPDWDRLSRVMHHNLLFPGKREFGANQGFPVSPNTVRLSGDTLTATGVRFDVIKETLEVATDSRSYFYDVLEFLFGSSISWVLASIIPERPRTHMYRTGIPLLLAVLRTFLGDSNLGFVTETTPRPTSIDARNVWFDRLAAAFLLLIGLEEMQMARLPVSFLQYYPCAIPLTTTRPPTIISPQTAAEIFLPARSYHCPYPEILRSPSVARLLSDRGEDDFQALKTISPFHSKQSKPFRTRNGYIGYGNQGIQEGDLICVLAASSFPVVLRRVGAHYVFISLCFVLGCMEGEVWPTVENRQRVVEEFNIR